jgi:hypothetical protein
MRSRGFRPTDAQHTIREDPKKGRLSFSRQRMPPCKFVHAIDTVARIPWYVEMATRNAIYGRPGACYLDFPDDMITGKVDEDKVVQVERAPDPPRTVAPQEYIEDALNLLEKAERPLVLVGKGMAWSHAEDEVRAFLDANNVPALADGQGGDAGRPSAVGRGGAHLGIAERRRRVSDGRSVQLHLPPPAFRGGRFGPGAALCPEPQGHPARHRARGDRPQQGDRGGLGRPTGRA